MPTKVNTMSQLIESTNLYPNESIVWVEELETSFLLEDGEWIQFICEEV